MNKNEIIESLKRRENYTNDLRGMQLVALDLLKEFDKICRRNNIEYWLDGGTLLGAVRHKGFIPWDDDIDVCVKKEDEERLKMCLEKELPFYMYLEKFYCEEYFYKIKDKYSRLSDDKVSLHSIWIDIFYMSNIKESKEDENIIKNLKEKRRKKKIATYKKWLNFREKIRWFFYDLVGIKDATEEIENIFKKLAKEKTDSVIYMTGKLWWHTYKKEWIFPLKEIEFEGYKFLCPNNYDKYLTSYYGNYMQLPPEEKRKPYHIKEIDIFNEKEDKEHLKWSDREKLIESL